MSGGSYIDICLLVDVSVTSFYNFVGTAMKALINCKDLHDDDDVLWSGVHSNTAMSVGRAERQRRSSTSGFKVHVPCTLFKFSKSV